MDLKLQRTDVKTVRRDEEGIKKARDNIERCVLVSFADFGDEGIVAFVAGRGTYERCHELMEHVACPTMLGPICKTASAKCGIMTESDWEKFSRR